MTVFLMIFRRFPTTFRRFPKIVPKARRTFPNVFREFTKTLGRPSNVSMIYQLSTWHQDHNQTGILRFFIESTCTIFWYKVKRRNYTFKETECKYFHFVGRCVIIPSLFLRHWKQLTYMYLGTFLAILVTLFPFTHYGNQNGPSLEPWPNSFPITFIFLGQEDHC